MKKMNFFRTLALALALSSKGKVPSHKKKQHFQKAQYIRVLQR